MSCEACFQSEKEKQQRLSAIFNEAKKWCIQHQKSAVIYLNETGEAVYMEREAAQALNIFGQVVTPL